MGGNEPKVELPAYNKPSASSFNNMGFSASYNPNTNTYSSFASPDELATMQATKKIRNDLLTSLGLDGTPQSDPYTNQYMQELLRTSQAPLENALIGRGLGGSTVYKDALTDLMTKASTQAVLGGQQYKMNNLNALSNYLNMNMGYGGDLLSRLTNQYNADQAQAWRQYMDLLPYTATVNTGGDGLSGALSGALSGGMQGAMVGGPWGAAAGALIGGGLGYAGSSGKSKTPLALYGNGQSSSSGGMGGMGGMDLSSLMGLFGGKKSNTANISGMGTVGVAPDNYYLRN